MEDPGVTGHRGNQPVLQPGLLVAISTPMACQDLLPVTPNPLNLLPVCGSEPHWALVFLNRKLYGDFWENIEPHTGK